MPISFEKLAPVDQNKLNLQLILSVVCIKPSHNIILTKVIQDNIVEIPFEFSPFDNNNHIADCLRLLLDQGGDANSQRQDQITPLHLAAGEGQTM